MSDRNGSKNPGTGWLKLPNAFIDEWLPDLRRADEAAKARGQRLTNIEALTWIVLNRYTNKSSITFATPKKVAAHLGVTSRTIDTAIQRLTLLGLLKTVNRGGGRGNAAERHVRLPKNPTLPKVVNSEAHFGESDEETTKPASEIETETPKSGAVNSETGRTKLRNLRHETPKPTSEQQDVLTRQLKRQHQQQQAEPAAPAGGDVVVSTSLGDGGKGKDANEFLIDHLRSFGVMDPTPQKLVAEIPGLTAHVVSHIARGRPKGTGGGMFVQMIRAQAPKLIDKFRLDELRYAEQEQQAKERDNRCAQVSAQISDADVVDLWEVACQRMDSLRDLPAPSEATRRHKAFIAEVESIAYAEAPIGEMLATYRTLAEEIRRRQKIRRHIQAEAERRLREMPEAEVMALAGSVHCATKPKDRLAAIVHPSVRSMMEAQIKRDINGPLDLPAKAPRIKATLTAEQLADKRRAEARGEHYTPMPSGSRRLTPVIYDEDPTHKDVNKDWPCTAEEADALIGDEAAETNGKARHHKGMEENLKL